MAQTLDEFEAEIFNMRDAIAAAGWYRGAAYMLLAKSSTPAECRANLYEAELIRSFVKVMREQIQNAAPGLDIDNAVNESVAHGLTPAECRGAIVEILAKHDELTHTDTTRRIETFSAHGDVYAERKAQMRGSK